MAIAVPVEGIALPCGGCRTRKRNPREYKRLRFTGTGSGARTRTLPLLDEGTALSGQISANSLQFTALSVLLEKSSDGVAGDLGRSRGTSEGREHAHSMHHPDLQLIIDAWGMLPDDVRKQMLTILRDFELLGQRDSA